jgi:uncharacterized damage-inducible protein DinB
MEISEYINRLDKNTETAIALAKSCTPEQLKQKPNEGWSIAQVLEHICMTELSICKRISKPSEKSNKTATIYGNEKMEKILVGYRDRKVAAPDFLEPKDDITTAEEFEKVFTAQRNRLKDDLISGKLVIDNKVYLHPRLGEMTMSDWLNFLIHHTQRHLEQVKDLL